MGIAYSRFTRADGVSFELGHRVFVHESGASWALGACVLQVLEHRDDGKVFATVTQAQPPYRGWSGPIACLSRELVDGSCAPQTPRWEAQPYAVPPPKREDIVEPGYDRHYLARALFDLKMHVEAMRLAETLADGGAQYWKVLEVMWTKTKLPEREAATKEATNLFRSLDARRNRFKR